MAKRYQLLAILVIALTAIPGCQAGLPFGGAQGEEQPRTYYESLNLETPEDAVRTFADAFQHDDFVTVYLVLAPDAQFGMRIEFNQSGNYAHLIDVRDTLEFLEDVNIDYRELFDIQTDYWYTFDRLMLAATQEDELLIDLHGDLTIIGTEDSETFEGDDAEDVTAEVEGVRGDVTFRMVRDPERRWRVFWVGAPRDGVDSWPWAMPTSDE
jgi:hypothetical protein